MPPIELRCRGTQRGLCGFPLVEPIDKLRKRCSEHFTEWLSNIENGNCTVIYHDNCDDGFGAAWIAHKILPPNTKFIPVQHGVKPPLIPRGRTLFMLDFAYPYEIMKRWITGKYNESFVVLDHHKSAFEDLGRFVNHTFFDMHKSGAMITWEFFFAPTPAPKLIEYVQDRDLFLKRLEYSDQVTSAIRSYSRTFESWDTLEKTNIKDLVIDGYSILRYTSNQIEELCKKAKMTTIGSYIVPVVNASNFMSELGQMLCKKYPESKFSASYFDREDGNRQWSLRSIGEFDVSIIAKQFGGGGHKNAAGFITSTPVVSFLKLSNEAEESFYEATRKTSGGSKRRK